MRVIPRSLGRACVMVTAVASLTVGCSGISEEQRGRSMREYELALTMYRDEKNAQGALVALERSLKLDPDNAEALVLLGTLYGASGMYDRAEAPLAHAVELLKKEASEDPNRRARYVEARNTWAAALINLGRTEQAIGVLQELAGDVHNTVPHLTFGNLGLAYMTARRYQDALAPLQRAVAVQPGFCIGHYRLGEAYLRLDQYAPALESLDRALDPKLEGCGLNQAAWRARGEVHVRLHQPDAAREDFVHCRDMSPDTKDGRECTAFLRSENTP